MADSHDPAALYPDIATEGSLAAALQAVAVRDGLSVAFEASESAALQQASVASGIPHRTVLSISAWAVERRWSIRGCESFQGLVLVDGSTGDLVQLARAAQAWQDGEELADIHSVAPFVDLSGRFEVPDGDPVRLIESEWQHLLTEADAANWPEYRALIKAAHAEPVLRGLYPFTSHWTLRFSTSIRPHLTDVPLCLDAHRQKPYTVSTRYLGEILAAAPTAEEIVSIAIRHLSSDLGTATSGTD
ncbi:DUF6193 family natural product biosynthesis protein [Kitasatospora sp. NPDC002040]|uniref:DUF6193 family natural product biosynthesis protein n=1 Tax=Kitasatospora sp. NPDC002040 TaxID=3154661 RepID=UPI0033339783